MAKTKISEFDSNPVNNTDIDGINLAEGMAPGLVNNAIRELMALLKDFQVGTAGDPFTVGGNLSVTGTTALTGAATLAGRAIDAFPSGTKMLFQQTAAPTGWTKDTTHDNKALRVVSGTAGSGGTSSFTSVFSGSTVGATALTEAQLPSHTHGFSATTSSVNLTHNHGVTDPGHFHNAPSGGFSGGAAAAGGDVGFNKHTAATLTTNTKTTGISINNALGSHNHTVSGTISSTGSGATHTHTLDLAVQYVDLIICTKS
jgi:hypothetical protein